MTTLTSFTIAYAPLLRHLTSHAYPEGESFAQDLNAVAKAVGKVPSNLRRDLPRLREAGLLEAKGLILTAAGSAALTAIDGAPPQTAAGAEPGLLHAQIAPDPHNPRTVFDEDAIEELAASIHEHGLIQGLTVRPADASGFHRLVAGERRWRAIGLLIARGDWPADQPIRTSIVDVDDGQAALLALIENLQREDLNPMEEARAFNVLRTDHALSTADIAAKIGKSQRHVQDRLSFLKLDEQDQQNVAEGRYNIEQARNLASRATIAAAEEVELSDDVLFVMAELAHRWKYLPKRKDSYWQETEIRHGVKDPILLQLRSLGFVDVFTEAFNSERTYARRGHKWPHKRELPQIPEGTAIYRTAWLNGPFPIPKEGLKRLEDKKRRSAETRDANKTAKAKAEQLAAEVDALVAKPIGAATAEEFAQLMKRAGSGWPWNLTKDGAQAQGLDYGVGVNLYGLNRSLVRLLVFAVNAAGATPGDQVALRSAKVDDDLEVAEPDALDAWAARAPNNPEQTELEDAIAHAPASFADQVRQSAEELT